MANPTSAAQGQGLAQVIQTGAAANAVMQQKQADAAAEAARRKKEEEAIKELRGDYEGLLKAKLWQTRDGEEYNKKVKDLFEYTRKAGTRLTDPTSPEYAEYMRLKMDAWDFANKSAEAKEYAKEIDGGLFGKDADKYTDDQRNEFVSWSSTPGNFELPRYAADYKIDLEKEFNDSVYTPLYRDAQNKKTSGSNFDRDKLERTSYSVTQSDPEVAGALFEAWIADPKVVSTIEARYGKQAKEKGMTAVDYYRDLKKNQLEFKSTDYDKTPMSDGGSGKTKTFDPNNIIDDYKYLQDQGVTFGGRTYQTEKVKSNAPTTENVYDVNSKAKAKSGQAGEIEYSYPTLTMVDANGKPLPMGAKGGTPKILVFGEGYVGDVRTTIVRPFEEVEDAFKEAGYDTEAIKQGLTGKSAAAGPKKKEIKQSDVAAAAKKAGYSVSEYTEMLKKNGIIITK